MPTRNTRPPVTIRAGIGLPKKAALYTMTFPPEQRLTALPRATPASPHADHHQVPGRTGKMRVAGRLAADVLDMIGPHVQPGVTTDELDRLCHDFIVQVQKAIPANVGYHGFPKTICSSVNHVVCHGIPNDKKLKNGDIINIDVTVIQRRLPRRHQPHVLRGQATGAGRAPGAGDPRGHVGRHRAGAPRHAARRHRPRHPDAGRRPKAFRWCASTAGMASAASTTRTRRCCTTASPTPARCCARA